ncbi:citrate:H+ symporter [Romboutsia ilealis]|uniref:Citrate:H+ symporter n=1 Tax=Romboutsia faecis TaxID=2764597 RepID=A0ABR7JQI2_9FIRM|nr:citrate:proton symporter [Romboutsia faecis]MBC5997170.1 citrate:H+ symporter [Romboutsia faecis]MRN23452.1 citrate:H+ symporter [Romboutsia ilealis]
MLSIIGYVMLLSMIYLLLKGKSSPIVLFISLPILAGLLGGFSPVEIGEFAAAGLEKTTSNAVLFIFSITYFGIMNDAGMFDILIDKLVKKAGNSVVAITVVTAIIGIIGHLDGATATTVLVTIPAMLPLYKKLNIRPQVLLLIVAAAMGVMNLLPWGGPTARTAVVLGIEANELWKVLIPIQIVGVFTTVGLAVILGSIEKKRGAGFDSSKLSNENNLATAELAATMTADELSLKRPKLSWFNILLTGCVIGVLVADIMPAYIVFMAALSIAIIVNYPNKKDQESRIKAHAPAALLISATMLASGVFVGVLGESGMLDAMAKTLLSLIPSFLAPFIHLIMGVVALPIGMFLGTDAYFYGLLPLVIEVAQTYGITAMNVALTMILGKNVALLISPLVPATFLATGLADVELKDHIKFCFGWLFAISLIMLAFGIVFRIVSI